MKKVIFLLLFTFAIIDACTAVTATVCKKSEKIKHASKRAQKKIKTEVVSKEEESSPLTGTFDITSNYLFRGISQSNNIPAFQGGLTYTFKKPGVYFNIWGSNVYAPVNSTSTATLEIDANMGVANSLNDHTSYDIHFVRYYYPKARNFEYDELIGSWTYHFLTGLIGYSNNVFNSGRSGTYYNLAVNLDIPSRYIYFTAISFNGSIGYYSLPKDAGNSYKDYALTLNKNIKNYTLTIQWADTDHRLLDNSLDHSHLIVMVTADF